ncbi:MAG TPA: hypothetical protein VK194_03655, partial [Candidatus Deferrimicrobium sp.]|nr:hypothetical protein [Candidatus Deferrimicrobium sp.]
MTHDFTSRPDHPPATVAPPRPADPLPSPIEGRRAIGRSVAVLWPAVAAFAAFVAAWKLVAVFAGLAFILPAPEDVGARFVAAWADGTMAPHA